MGQEGRVDSLEPEKSPSVPGEVETRNCLDDLSSRNVWTMHVYYNRVKILNDSNVENVLPQNAISYKCFGQIVIFTIIFTHYG